MLNTKLKRNNRQSNQTDQDWVNNIKFNTAPSDGQIAIEQRLHNLIELAINIGSREGLFGDHKISQISFAGGNQNVTDQRNQ